MYVYVYIYIYYYHRLATRWDPEKSQGSVLRILLTSVYQLFVFYIYILAEEQ